MQGLKKNYFTIIAVGVFYVSRVFLNLPDGFEHTFFPKFWDRSLYLTDMGQGSIWSNLVESSADRLSLQEVCFGINLLLIFPLIHTVFFFGGLSRFF